MRAIQMVSEPSISNWKLIWFWRWGCPIVSNTLTPCCRKSKEVMAFIGVGFAVVVRMVAYIGVVVKAPNQPTSDTLYHLHFFNTLLFAITLI
jgi:hypothetical protein